MSTAPLHAGDGMGGGEVWPIVKRDNSTVAVADTDGRVRVYDILSGKQVDRVSGVESSPEGLLVRCLDLAKNAASLLINSFRAEVTPRPITHQEEIA